MFTPPCRPALWDASNARRIPTSSLRALFRSNQPGGAAACAPACFCALGAVLQKAAVASGKPPPMTFNIEDPSTQSCALAVFPALMAKGLTTGELERAAACGAATACAPPPPPPAGAGNASASPFAAAAVNVSAPAPDGGQPSAGSASGAASPAYAARVVITACLAGVALLLAFIAALSAPLGGRGAVAACSALRRITVVPACCASGGSSGRPRANHPPASAAPLLASLSDRLEFVDLRVVAAKCPLAPPLLADARLALRRGRLVALMGASGSGKSTLLSVLAGRRPLDSAACSSDGLVATGRCVSRPSSSSSSSSAAAAAAPALVGASALAASCGFVPQSDEALHPLLTVQEALWFDAACTQPPPPPPQSHRAWRAASRRHAASIDGAEAAPSDGRFSDRGGNAAAVDAAIASLGLSSCAARRCGALSGGERRRACVARALVSRPHAPLLLLDEPTTSLDAASASAMVATLRRLAGGGGAVTSTGLNTPLRDIEAPVEAPPPPPHPSISAPLALQARLPPAIVLAIHQPSRDMFLSFDTIILLSAGRIVWHGAPSHAMAALASAGCAPPRASFAGGAEAVWAINPAEALLCAASADAGAAALEAAMLTGDAAAEAAVAAGGVDTWGGGLAHAKGVEAQVAPSPSPVSPQQQPPPPMRRFAALMWRERVTCTRRPALFLAHLATAVALGLWLGGVFWQARPARIVCYVSEATHTCRCDRQGVTPDLAGFQNALGASFFSLVSASFAAASAADALAADWHRLCAEASDALYPPWMLYTARATSDALLLRVAPVAVYAAILYPMAGFSPGFSEFGVFLGVLVLNALASSALSLLVAAVAAGPPGRAGVASVRAPLFAIFDFLLAHGSFSFTSFVQLVFTALILQSAIFSGFLANTGTLPPPVSWLRHLSLTRYGLEVTASNQLSSASLSLAVPGLITLQDVSGKSFLETLGFDPTRVGLDFGCLACLCVLLHTTAAAALTARLPPAGGHPLRR